MLQSDHEAIAECEHSIIFSEHFQNKEEFWSPEFGYLIGHTTAVLTLAVTGPLLNGTIGHCPRLWLDQTLANDFFLFFVTLGTVNKAYVFTIRLTSFQCEIPILF